MVLIDQERAIIGTTCSLVPKLLERDHVSQGATPAELQCLRSGPWEPGNKATFSGGKAFD